MTELSALVAGARLALDALRAQPGSAPQEAISLLEKVLADFDAGRARLTSGQPPRDVG